MGGQSSVPWNPGRSTPYIGDGRPPTFNDGNPYFMGPYTFIWEYICAMV